MKKLFAILLLLPTLAFAQQNLSQGGTGWATSTKGDLLVGTSSTIRYTRLPIGSTGQVLWVNGGQPAWVATSSLGITGGTGTTYTCTYPILCPSTVISTGFSTSTTNVFTGLNTFQATTTVDKLQALTSAGLQLFSNNGTGIAILGAGGGASVSFLDGGSFTNYLRVGGSVAGDSIFEAKATTVDGSTGIIHGYDSGGTELFSLMSNGKLGLGSTSPSAILSIKGTTTLATSPLLTIASSTGSTLFTVLHNGNTGIGTLTPTYKLDVNGGSITSQLHFTSAGNDTGGYLTSAGVANFFASAGASYLSGTGWVAKATNASIIGGGASNDGGIDFYTNTRLTAWNTYTPTETMKLSGAGGLSLGTSYISTDAGVNNMIIQGKLGVGTTTPVEKLHVQGGLRLTGNFMDSTNATGTVGQVLQSTGTSTLWVSTSSLGITASLSGGNNGFLTRWTGANTVSTGISLDNGTVAGINATTSTSTFMVQGNAGTNNVLTVASSSGSPMVTVTNTGLIGVASSSPVYQLTVATGTIFCSEYVPNATSTAMTLNVQNGCTTLIKYGVANMVISFSNVIAGMSWKVKTVAPPSGTPGLVFFATTTPGITWCNATTQPTSTQVVKKSDIWSFYATTGSSSSVTSPEIDGCITPNF